MGPLLQLILEFATLEILKKRHKLTAVFDGVRCERSGVGRPLELVGIVNEKI